MKGELEASREAAKARSWDAEALSALVVDCAYNLHVEAGPGLMESVYEVILARMLEKRGARVQRQVPVHAKQTLTYIRLSGLPMIGLLINFGAPTFKEGIERIVNRHQNFASSRLRVNQGLSTGISREAAKARRWEDVP